MVKFMTAQQGFDKIDLTTEVVVKRILRTFNRATAQDIAEGVTWYDEAGRLAEWLSYNSPYTVPQIAAAMAHLSPRLKWSQNVDAINALVLTGEAPWYVMSGPAGRARKALVAADPDTTFGKRAKKTLAFSHNIAGCQQSVTVDVWIAKVVGVTEQQLKLEGVYEAIVHAYRLAAKRVGLHPSQLQAVTWIVQRGSAT